MLDRDHYRAKYLCSYVIRDFSNQTSPYEYLVECRDFLYNSPEIIDHKMPILKLTNLNEQLILFMDRDYFFLNWRKYEHSELEFERTIASWQSCSQFKEMDPLAFEFWLLDRLEHAKAMG